METFITGSGAFLPDRVVTNEELAETLGIDAQWIFKASGIRRRRWATPGTTTSSIAAEALALALRDAQLTPSDIDYLLFGTMTPDRLIPGSGSAVQHTLGLPQIPCLDIRATCCNALYALQLAAALVNSGTAKHVAICLADIQSPWLDLSPTSASTAMLFGDGASALIVSNANGPGSLAVVDILLATDGTFVDDLGVRCPGTEFGNTINHPAEEHGEDYLARMAGQSVILQASRKITAACQGLLGRNELSVEDIRWIVPHQANANLLAQIARTLRFERKDGMISVLEDFGNTSSASMGIALDRLRRSGLISTNDYLLLPAFGAGFTWGAALCQARPTS